MTIEGPKSALGEQNINLLISIKCKLFKNK
jgi:hypothetical protein